MAATGKGTAFISAAGRNLGRALALEFARRGCRLVINAQRDREACEATAEEARRLSGAEVLVVMGDVGEAAVMKEIAARALERFGTVDIVVNNAGYRPYQSFLELTDDDWHRVMNVNLHAPFQACRLFAPGMVAQGWGRIVNILGMNVMRGHAHRVAPSASKHAVLGMTKALAKELGPSGGTVNAISPGYLRGDNETAEERSRKDAVAATEIPVRRIGDNAEIAALAGFLCSPEGGYVNGQMISQNGGLET